MLHVSSVPNCWSLRSLLRARLERPSNRCAGDDREEIAPVHANCLWSRQSLAKGGAVRHSKIGPRTPLWGQTRRVGMLATLAACPPTKSVPRNDPADVPIAVLESCLLQTQYGECFLRPRHFLAQHAFIPA